MGSTVHQDQHIDAPPADVWRIVGDVGNAAEWIPALESSHLDGDIRHAEFAGGAGSAREQIVHVDDAARSYTYRYLDGPLDLAEYVSTITVVAEADGSRVDWDAQFTAGDPAAEAGLTEAIDGLYASALAELADRFG